MTRRIVRHALLLALLGALVIEGIAWVRIPLAEFVHLAYPRVALLDDGAIVKYDEEESNTNGQKVVTTYYLDEDRHVIGTAGRGRVALVGHRWRSVTGLRGFTFDHPGFLLRTRIGSGRRPDAFDLAVPDGPLDALARDLNVREAERRRPIGLGGNAGREGAYRAPNLKLEWRADAGRLVCREVASGRLLAGLGPDGFVRGDRGAEGDRFGDLAGCAVTSRGSAAEFVMLESDTRRLAVVGVPEGKFARPDSIETLDLAVEMRPLRPLDASDDGTREAIAWIALLDNEHVLFFDDGAVFGRFVPGPDERIVGAPKVRPLNVVRGSWNWEDDARKQPTSKLVAGVETFEWPAPPDMERRRLRLFRPGQEPIEHHVTFEPARASEYLPANVAASLALLRPFPLSIASAASELPARWHSWWWRDPWLADGRYPGWLVASLALAAFLAWRARRSARQRCATVREVRFWTAAVFLLGPLGLFWMRLVLPRVPVESVGQARRAVNLDSSPSTNAPWPEPKPLGIEVIS